MNNNPFEAGSSHQRDKILISRLDRSSPPPGKKRIERNREDRVTRACKACRKRKVKCSGDIPRCSHCQLNSLDCVYEQARRDRLTEATHLNQVLAALLRDLSGRVNNEDKQRIDDALHEANNDLFLQETRSSQISLGKRFRRHSIDENDQETTPHGEAHVTASAGSNENLDNLDENLMRDRGSRATGYVGHNSEVQWLRSVQRQSEQTGADLRDQPYGPPGSSRDAIGARSDALHTRQSIAKENFREGSMKHITDSTFYLDSEDIEFDIIVDPNEDPEPDVAERLFNCYLETVHPSFPLVPANFEDQFRKYLESRRQKGTLEIPRWWRAQMNLLFAIGAKYSHLVGAQWRGDERDHLLYMTRAVHLLDFKNNFMIFSVPDIHLVQATGALSFYFLAIGHVSRAWVTIGLSIRLALALGLNLRNEDPEAGEARKESLVHTWWSLHSIECLVSTITGRLPVVAIEDCTVPLPHNLSAERGNLDTFRNTSRKRTVYSRPESASNRSDAGRQSSGQGHYFVAHIKITLISQEVLLRIYSPRTVAQSWEFVQNRISKLLKELEEWASLALTESPRIRNQKQKSQSEREQLLLTMDYWSTKILITRPCLCRIEQRIQNESNTSMDFNTTSANDCVNAALEMVKLFPDKPDLQFIYSTAPWWAVVHLIIQAMSVLLLEMTYENKNVDVSDPNIHTSIKKLIYWLRTLQNNDPVASKAYKVIWKILKSCAPSLQSRVNDLLAFDKEPVTQPQTHPYCRSASGDKITEPWLPGEAQSNPIDTTGNPDPQTFQYQPFTNPSWYQNNPNTLYSPDEYLSPMPFGNLFFTSFDQGVSGINMQNLWSDVPPSNLYTTTMSDVETSHGGPENEPSLGTQHAPQQ